LSLISLIAFSTSLRKIWGPMWSSSTFSVPHSGFLVD
jgi:hypothetical protein